MAGVGSPGCWASCRMSCMQAGAEEALVARGASGQVEGGSGRAPGEPSSRRRAFASPSPASCRRCGWSPRRWERYRLPLASS